MTVTTHTALDWDGWRNAYHGLSYQQQQEFYSEVWKRFPEQHHFSAEHVAAAIEYVQPTTVVELGGWDGELALNMLACFPAIADWCNVELCREARLAGMDQRQTQRYHAPPLDDWYWTKDWHCDLFIASHTIEHLSVDHLNQTIAATHAEALFFDAPLDDRPLQWAGFTGTHILQTGWQGVTELCAKHGYVLDWAEDHETDPSSGDRARACLYLKESA